MILSLGKNPSPEAVEKISRRLSENGLASQVIVSGEATLVIITSSAESVPGHLFSQMEGVEKVIKLTNRAPLAAEGGCTFLNIGTEAAGRGRLAIGSGKPPVVIAGPCSVESREHILETAQAVKLAGAHALRGGAYKPRTNPYDFQGLGLDGLKAEVNAKLAATEAERDQLRSDLHSRTSERDELRRYRSEAELDLMRRIKNALDPKGLCNPGKVL